MASTLTWRNLRPSRTLDEAETELLERQLEDEDTHRGFATLVERLPSTFPGVTWHALVETDSRRFVFYESDGDGLFQEEAAFSLHALELEVPPRTSDEDHVIATCTPGEAEAIAHVIEQAWEDDGGELVVDERRVRLPKTWRSHRHAKWAFSKIAPMLVEPCALVIDVKHRRGEEVRREFRSVVLRSGGITFRPAWLVVPDDDEWTTIAQSLLLTVV